MHLPVIEAAIRAVLKDGCGAGSYLATAHIARLCEPLRHLKPSSRTQVALHHLRKMKAAGEVESDATEWPIIWRLAKR